MKILQISSARTFGRSEKHLVDLSRGLTERGHEVFVALRPSNQWQAKLDFLPLENVFHDSLRNSFGVFSAPRIARFASEKNIEIIHAHVARDYIPASLACRLTKNSKFVLTRHIFYPMKPFHRLTLTNLARAIAVSPTVENVMQSIIPKRKIEVIPHGINTENLSDEEKKKRREEFRALHNIPAEAIVVGTVGELKEPKGQRDFVLAANEIGQRNKDAFFVIVGRDRTVNQKFRRELKRLVKIFNLAERFLWLDWVDDMQSLLASVDVYVSASHTEGFGIVILEAMANKTPIVATETEGAKALLKNDETGLLVSMKEPLVLAGAIEKLLRNAEKRRALAENAFSSAADQFSLSDMVEKTENLYREIFV